MQTTRDFATLIPFAASVVFGLLAWGAVSRTYFWPRLRELPLQRAAQPILHLHLFRFVGLAFMVPGVAGLNLPAAFAATDAYGDLISMMLAWLALMAGSGRFARPALWLFSVWGTSDLLFAYYQGTIGVGIDPASLGATWFIPSVGVPLLFWTHVMLFGLLVRDARARGTPVSKVSKVSKVSSPISG